MPIRVNLLAEALAAEELRRHDPAKYAGIFGLLLVALMLAWYSSAWVTTKSEEHDLETLQRKIEMQTNDVNQVFSNQKKITDIQARIAALDKLNRIRFLQGNLLNALQQTYVTNVQLIRARVDQTYTSLPGTPAQKGPGGLIPARPGSVTEHVVLRLEAKDSSPTPGDQVQRFKDVAGSQDYFKTAIGSTNGVSLAYLSPIQTPGDGKPFVFFNLDCRFATKP